MSLLFLFGGSSGVVIPPGTSTITGTHVWLYDPGNLGVIELTTDVYAVSITRGRSRDLDVINAGTARIQCRNTTGNFGPFDFGDYGTLTIGKPIIVTYGTNTTDAILGTVGIPVFFGFIEDFNYEWEPGRFTDCTITAADGLARLARNTFTAWTGAAAQATGARYTSIFARTEVDSQWMLEAASPSLDTGAVTLQADSIEHGTNVLSYCQEVNRAEAGRFFVARNNTLTFQQRGAVGNVTSVDFDGAATGSTANEIPFTNVEVRYGAELLYNRVSVDRIGGVVQTNDDITSIGIYGIRTLSISNLLLENDTQCDTLGFYILDNYANPEAVVDSVTVALEKLSTANRDIVCGLEIGDQVTMHWTPTGQSAVASTLSIEGIDYSKSLNTPTEIKFQLSLTPSN